MVGVLTILASLLGYAGSQFRPQLLLAYLIVGAVGAVAQLIIVLAIFFAQPEVASAIENMNTQGSITAAYIKEKDRSAASSRLLHDRQYLAERICSIKQRAAPRNKPPSQTLCIPISQPSMPFTTCLWAQGMHISGGSKYLDHADNSSLRSLKLESGFSSG